METVLTFLRDHIGDEWKAIAAAPFAFALALALVGAALYFIFKAYFAERIRALEATVGHKQSVLDEYRERLHGATPLEVAAELVDLRAKVARLIDRVDVPQRRISEKQEQILKAKIAASPDLLNFNLELSHTADTESGRYAMALRRVFAAAGLNLLYGGPGTHDEGERGLILYVGDVANLTSQASALADALRAAEIDFVLETDEYYEERGQFYLFVSPDIDI